MRSLYLWGSLAVLLSAPSAVEAADQQKGVSTAPPRPRTTINSNCPSSPNAQVRNFSCSEASALIQKLKKAQTKLKAGEQLYFELLSGALASDPVTKVSPREAFMNMPFDKAFIIERVRTGNLLWQPYKFAYRPPGAGRMIWDAEVVLGFSDQRLLRVQMLYRPPAPF